MKHHIKKIQLKTPCNQDWNSMSDSAGGKFCMSCNKNVIDFSTLTNPEILDYLSGQNKLCGRFDKNQLDELNILLSGNKSSYSLIKRLSLAAAVAGAVPFSGVRAQAIVNEQHQTTKKTMPAETGEYIVRGCVSDSDGMPLAGAAIRITGTDIKTGTNVQGDYMLIAPANTDSIEFSYVGYLPQKIKLDPKHIDQAEVILMEDKNMLNNVTVIAGGIYIRRSFFYRVWYSIKRPFKTIFHS